MGDISVVSRCYYYWTSLVVQVVKNLPAMWETWVWSLGQEDPLEKEMATHTSILAWEIPWTEKPCGYSPRVTESDMTEWLTHFQHTIIITFFWLYHTACRILVPWPGIKPMPLQWKLGILTTEPSGKSPYYYYCYFHFTDKKTWVREVKWFPQVDSRLNPRLSNSKAVS